MNISTCKQHELPKTHICLFNNCPNSFSLLCEKCCQHTEHKNKIFLFKDLKQKLIKSKPNPLEYGLELRSYEFRNKIRHFRNFRHFILEKEKILFQKQKQMRKFLTQLHSEENIINNSITKMDEKFTQQQINTALNAIRPMVNFHTINNKLILGSKDFRKKQEGLHCTVQKGLECISSIQEYLIKIIQVLMYQTENTDLQQQKIANAKYSILTEIQSMLKEETQMLQEQITTKKECLDIMKMSSRKEIELKFDNYLSEDYKIIEQEKINLEKINNEKNNQIIKLKEIVQKRQDKIKLLQQIYKQQIIDLKHELKNVKKDLQAIKQQIQQTIYDQIDTFDHSNFQLKQLSKIFKCSTAQVFTTIPAHTQNLNKKINTITTENQNLKQQILQKIDKINSLNQTNNHLRIQTNKDKQLYTQKLEKLKEQIEVLRKNHIKLNRMEEQCKSSRVKVNYSLVSSRKKQKSLYQSAKLSQFKRQQLNLSSQRNSQSSQIENIIYTYRQQSQQKVHLMKDALNQKEKIIKDINKQLDLIYKQKEKIYKNYLNSENQRLKQRKIAEEYELKNAELKQQNNQLLYLLNKFKSELQNSELIIRNNQTQISQLQKQLLKLQIQVKKKDEAVVVCRKELNILRAQVEKDLINAQVQKKKKAEFSMRRIYYDNIKKQIFKQNSQQINLSQQCIPVYLNDQRRSHEIISQKPVKKQQNTHRTCESFNSLGKKSQIQEHLKTQKIFQAMNKDVITFQNKLIEENAIQNIYEKQLDKKRNQNNLLKRQLAEFKRKQLINQSNIIMKPKNKRIMTTSCIQ